MRLIPSKCRRRLPLPPKTRQTNRTIIISFASKPTARISAPIAHGTPVSRTIIYKTGNVQNDYRGRFEKRSLSLPVFAMVYQLYVVYALGLPMYFTGCSGYNVMRLHLFYILIVGFRIGRQIVFGSVNLEICRPTRTAHVDHDEIQSNFGHDHVDLSSANVPSMDPYTVLMPT